MAYQLPAHTGYWREGVKMERMKQGGLLQDSQLYRVGEAVRDSFIPPNSLKRSEKFKGQDANVTVVLRWKEG